MLVQKLAFLRALLQGPHGGLSPHHGGVSAGATSRHRILERVVQLARCPVSASQQILLVKDCCLLTFVFVVNDFSTSYYFLVCKLMVNYPSKSDL